eukprot:3395763-Heterocapsa_arctica.AAC.1
MVPGTSCASGRSSWLAATAHRPSIVSALRKQKPHERVRRRPPDLGRGCGHREAPTNSRY